MLVTLSNLIFNNMTKIIYKLLACVSAGVTVLVLSSCFSLLKADKMVYAGSIGKKVDAVLIDSISKIDVNKSE